MTINDYKLQRLQATKMENNRTWYNQIIFQKKKTKILTNYFSKKEDEKQLCENGYIFLEVIEGINKEVVRFDYGEWLKVLWGCFTKKYNHNKNIVME